MNKSLKEAIKLLEAVTGKRVILREANEASRNLAVESLKAVSEAIDVVRQQLTIAGTQCQQLGDEFVSGKLRTIQGMMDDQISLAVAEMITSVTGMETKEDMLDDDTEMLGEAMGDDDKGIEMTMDQAMGNTQDVKKVIDSGMNVKLKDDNM